MNKIIQNNKVNYLFLSLFIIVAISLGIYALSVQSSIKTLRTHQEEKCVGADSGKCSELENEIPARDAIPDTWKIHQSKIVNAEIAYPENWIVMTECQQGSSDEFKHLALAENQEYLTFCGSDKPSQVEVIPPDLLNSDSSGEFECGSIEDTEFSRNATCEVINDLKYEVIRSSSVGTGKAIDPEGTEYVRYTFKTGPSEYYIVAYTKLPEWPDNLAIFERMVKSFKILD